MCVNPAVVKQLARKRCPVGMLLWRYLISSAGSSSGGLPSSRIVITPAQLRTALSTFSAQDPAHASFLAATEDNNLHQHLSTFLQMLNPTDDPLTISADVLTDR